MDEITQAEVVAEHTASYWCLCVCVFVCVVAFRNTHRKPWELFRSSDSQWRNTELCQRLAGMD